MKRGRDVDGLRDHLFEAIERLEKVGSSQEDLDREVLRAQAIGGLARTIIDAAKAESRHLALTKGQDIGGFLAPSTRPALPERGHEG